MINQEVEIRVKLNNVEEENILKKLQTKGAVVKGRKKLIDKYYCPSNVKSFSEIEMDKVGSYSLRLRKENKIITMNTKIITQDGDHNSWKEYETIVDSFTQAEAILLSIGFKCYFTLEKTRIAILYKHFTINIENVVDFGVIVEIEILTNKENSELAKKDIFQLMEELTIPRNNIIEKSVTNLLMKRLSIF